MPFLPSPRRARRPRSSAPAPVPRRRDLQPGGGSPGAADRPDPAFAKKESATSASRRRQRVARLPVGAAAPRQGIKTSPKCQRESTAETPNAVFTEPPTGAATPELGAGAGPPAARSAAWRRLARRRRPPRSGIRQKGIGDAGPQAAPAGRSVACRRGGAPTRDKDQPEMSERKHGGVPNVIFTEPPTGA